MVSIQSLFSSRQDWIPLVVSWVGRLKGSTQHILLKFSFIPGCSAQSPSRVLHVHQTFLGAFSPTENSSSLLSLSRAAVPNLFGTRDRFHGRYSFVVPGMVSSTLHSHFASRIIAGSTSDQKALDPGGWTLCSSVYYISLFPFRHWNVSPMRAGLIVCFFHWPVPRA